MNTIAYAGTIDDPSKERVSKCYEFILPEKGGKGVRIAAKGGQRGVGRGEVLIVPPLCPYVLTEYGANDLHVLVEKAMLPLKEVFTMTDVENEGVRHAAEQAVCFYASDYGKKEAVLSALGNLMVSYVTLVLGEGRSLSPVVATVRADIENNLSNSMYSLDEELKKLPLNYDYVRKLFKKEVGVTPHEYLISLRMDRAAGFLTGSLTNRYSKYSVSQVAEACGFAEPLYFSRVFKKYYGVSPSEYGGKNSDSDDGLPR